MIKHRFKTILGNCPPDWDAAPLSALLDLPGCQAGDWGDEIGEVAVRVIRSTNFTNDGQIDLSDVAIRYLPKKKAESMKLLQGDILIEKSGGSPVQPVGRVLLIEEDMAGYGFSNFIHRLRPDHTKINPRFLRWVLHELHRSGVVERLQNQTTQMRNLELRDYFCSRIPLPLPREQNAICTMLDSIDRIIVNAKEMLGITGSLRRDNMGGPLNQLKSSLLNHLVLGHARVHLDSAI
jgi:type I restriction enzyme S subunit